ncbi:MAG: hypothetical protein GF307_06435 [candidate division Zixibacteria bacterium]|nr:hypothetical protein [candidate division Zixibacteria bacterium]
MRLVSSDNIRKVCNNNYEAVLIAAQYARKINAERLNEAQYEDADEESQTNYKYKVTTQALYDLVDGKIKVAKSD